jgi:hypothetical protein
MTLLLDRLDQIVITEGMVSIIAGKFAEKAMSLLLDRRGGQITITEKVVEAAAGNCKNSKEVMALLLDRQGDQVSMTGGVIKAAKAIGGVDMLKLFFADPQGDY